MGNRQHLFALITSLVAPFASLGIFILRISEQNININIIGSNLLAIVGICYLAYFNYCLANCKEAAFFAARVPVDDPDGQRDSVCVLASIILIGSPFLQYFVLH